tara:strand:+ start:444 stop:611 length:168 start_codon:yes stop_codon:yes gene_type:complete
LLSRFKAAAGLLGRDGVVPLKCGQAATFQSVSDDMDFGRGDAVVIPSGSTSIVLW